MDKFDKIINEMTIDELIGQLICYCVPGGNDDATKASFEEKVKRTKPGSIFFNPSPDEKIKEFTRLANRNLKVPVIVAGDTENGPNTLADCKTKLPNPIAWASADDDTLIERGGVETARVCRKAGLHWSFAPLVDIWFNKDCAECVRVISDSPAQVARIGSAYVRGQQKDGIFAACAKHFPGAGTDYRNPHFCNPENNMTKEEWDKTYGMVYKKMIADGVLSIMTGHYTFPAYQSDAEYDEIQGYRPATLSYELTTKLLREELGFEGVIVSDAMCMVGMAAYVPHDRLAIECLKAGTDMLLFPGDDEFDFVKKAVEDGEISIERIKESVKRVLKLKEKVSLLDASEPIAEPNGDIRAIAQEIADKSIKVVRDADHLIPISAKKGGKVLMVNLYLRAGWDNQARMGNFEYMEKCLNDRGIKTISLINPLYTEIKKIYEEEKPDYVLINSRHTELDSLGNSRNITWDNIMSMWEGIIFEHDKVIYTSFGDPFKLYELPFLRTYVNAYAMEDASQEAFVKVLLGEIKPQGKNPVGLKGYFEREVE